MSKCKYCLDDKERVKSGYDPKLIKCECSVFQRFLDAFFQLVSLIIFTPILLSMVVLTGIVILIDKVFDCLD